MEELIEIPPWKLHCDVKATRAAYEQIKTGYAEICRCDHCLNWIEVRDRAFPKNVLEAFEKLGIDYRKEPEVAHVYRVKQGRHFYMGWFHFMGSVEQVSDEELVKDSYGLVEENFTWNFTDPESPRNRIFEKQQLGQIDFRTVVPWVINAKEPI